MNKRKAYIISVISVLLFCFIFLLVGCENKEESVIISSAEESFSSASEQSSDMHETGSIDNSLQDISSSSIEQSAESDETDFTRDFLEELYSCSKKQADEISRIRTTQESGKVLEYFNNIFGSRLAYSLFEVEIMNCYMTHVYSIAMANSADVSARISFYNYSDDKPYSYVAELFVSGRNAGRFAGAIDAELIDGEWKVSFLSL